MGAGADACSDDGSGNNPGGGGVFGSLSNSCAPSGSSTSSSGSPALEYAALAAAVGAEAGLPSCSSVRRAASDFSYFMRHASA